MDMDMDMDMNMNMDMKHDEHERDMHHTSRVHMHVRHWRFSLEACRPDKSTVHPDSADGVES